MIIVGGASNRVPKVSAAAYDPSRNRWRIMPPTIGSPIGHKAVWTGREVLIWGGRTQGQLLDPTADAWQRLPKPRPRLAGRIEHTAVWTGREVIVWGGEADNDCCYQFDGAAYVPDP
jgi:hypothetical protein